MLFAAIALVNRMAPEFQHSNRTTLSFDPEALEGRLSTGWGEAP